MDLIKLYNNVEIKLLIVVIVFDTIFGVLRAIRERTVNSTIGIDGIIRKSGMIISIIFLTIIDYLIKLDLIAFIPENIKQIINIKEVGICDLFNILFVVFEFLSIIKNMVRCKLPIPKKLQKFLEKILNEFTTEIKEKEGEK